MPFDWSSDVCRSEEHTSELQSHDNLVCRLLLEKKRHNTPIRLAAEGTRSSAGCWRACAFSLSAGESVSARVTPARHGWMVGCFCFFFLMIRRPPRSTLFPYTTPYH